LNRVSVLIGGGTVFLFMADEKLNLQEAINKVEAEDRLYSEKRGKLVINHERTANAMVKMVMLAPIHDTIKRIMILRIGSPLLKQKPLSHLAIALQLGMKESEVFKLEREGIEIVTEFMNRICLPEAVGKFNKEGSESEVRNILEGPNS